MSRRPFLVTGDFSHPMLPDLPRGYAPTARLKVSAGAIERNETREETCLHTPSQWQDERYVGQSFCRSATTRVR